MCDQWGGHKTGGRRKRKRRFRNPVTHKTGGGGQEEGKEDSVTLSSIRQVGRRRGKEIP